MSRRIPIINVTPNGVGPGSFSIGAITPDNTTGDWTAVFKGKYYRQKVTPFTAAPFYTSPTTPVGYDLIIATQFEVVENASYAGQYTVYTPVSAIDIQSSTFSAGVTTVHVNENVSAPISMGDASVGFITNVSTYYIYRSGSETALVVPPGVEIDVGDLSFPGRIFSGWAETFNQNTAHMLQHFAGSTAPVAPITGQLWFDLSTGLLKIWNGSSFVVANATAFAPATSAKIPFTASASTPVNVVHGLNSVSPYLVMTQFYADIGGGAYTVIVPSVITFVDANTIQVTFTASHTGYALVRV